MRAHPTPEAAVSAPNSRLGLSGTIVAVDRSPDGQHAVVFIICDESPRRELAVLCKKTPAGWVERNASGIGDGVQWSSTSEDCKLGVELTRPRSVRWDVPDPAEPWHPDFWNHDDVHARGTFTVERAQLSDSRDELL